MGTDGSYVQSEDGFAEFGDMVDSATFEQVRYISSTETGVRLKADLCLQILEMDDDEEEREFSRSIVYDFFTQAEGTFTKMDAELYLTLPTFPFCPSHPLY